MLEVLETIDKQGELRFIKLNEEGDDIEYEYNDRSSESLLIDRYNCFFDVSDRYGRRL